MEEKKKRTNWKEEAQRAILDGKFTNRQLQEFVEGKEETPVKVEETYSTFDQMKYDAFKEIIVNLLYKMEESEINDIFKTTLTRHKSMKERAKKIKAARNK